MLRVFGVSPASIRRSVGDTRIQSSKGSNKRCGANEGRVRHRRKEVNGDERNAPRVQNLSEDFPQPIGDHPEKRFGRTFFNWSEAIVVKGGEFPLAIFFIATRV